MGRITGKKVSKNNNLSVTEAEGIIWKKARKLWNSRVKSIEFQEIIFLSLNSEATFLHQRRLQ
jgi:hypothetical protein